MLKKKKKKKLFLVSFFSLARAHSRSLSFVNLISLNSYFTLSVSILGHGPLGLAIEQTALKQGWLYTASSTIGGAVCPKRMVHSSVSKSGSMVRGRPKASAKKASVGRLHRLVQRPTQPDSWR